MGKSESTRANGPDWTDIRGYLKELTRVYSVTPVVTFTTTKVQKNAELRVGVVATWPDLENEKKMGLSAVYAQYPTPDGVSMEALVYRLLHKLDYELTDARFYQTEHFPRA